MLVNDSDIKTREVTEWQGLHLLHFNQSSCSQKVRILMSELGIEFKPHHINLMKDEQKTDWYLGINARGQVPVLVHDGKVHIESNDIIEYLDQNFATPEASFLPTTDEERQQMHKLMDLEDELHADLRTVTFTYIAPDIHNHTSGTDGDLAFIGRFKAALDTLDNLLKDQPFLLGERMTLADISWFITLHRLHLAGYPFEEHQFLDGYYQKLAARKVFQQELAAGPIGLRIAGTVFRKIKSLKRSLAKDYVRWQQEAALPS